MEKRVAATAQRLASFGLSPKEAAVYAALLGLGQGTVAAISRAANINRTTGYDILASLVGKGLVSVSGKEPKQEYLAESPDALLVFLENRLQETQESITQARELVPELKSMHHIGDRPQIRFYEGIEGLKQAYEDTLTSHEDIRAFARVEDMFAALPGYFPSYFKRRAEKGIFARAIAPKTPMALERRQHDDSESRALALIPEEGFTITPEIDIYDNKVMIASWREKLGIIIESAEIAAAMKKIFELAWVEAQRLSALDTHSSRHSTNS